MMHDYYKVVERHEDHFISATIGSNLPMCVHYRFNEWSAAPIGGLFVFETLFSAMTFRSTLHPNEQFAVLRVECDVPPTPLHCPKVVIHGNTSSSKEFIELVWVYWMTKGYIRPDRLGLPPSGTLLCSKVRPLWEVI